MEFVYGDMWRWYRAASGTDAYPVTNDVIVRVYNADYGAMKYSRDGSKQPFTRPGIVVAQANDVAVIDELVFPHGVYLVTEADIKRDRKKALYFVFPCQRTETGGQVFFTGDHFTFCHDSNDKATPLHLHLTMYMPDALRPEYGVAWHIDNYLASSFTLPTTPDAFSDKFVKDNLVKIRAGGLHKLMSRPFQLQAQQGGARRRRNKAQRATRSAKRSFHDAWYELPLHKVIMVAVLRPDGMHDVTVTIHDRLHGGKSIDKGRHACVLFQVPPDKMSAAALEDEFARMYLSDLSWESFKPNAGHDDF